MTQKKEGLLTTAHQVLEDEIRSLQNLRSLINADLEIACKMIMECKGRIIFTGVGHSGHIANKSAANMSSLCKPAYFLHAGEAAHGDLGLVTEEDVVILISNSGETSEVLAILPQIKRLGVKTIAIVGNVTSSLAKACDVALPIGAEEEAGPFKFAGSSSALNTMALCDAMIIAITAYNGLREEDYLKAHPGGAVGKQLKEKHN
ncbi:MAG: SIS domain-containing protein [Pelolinea sp.]|nr:SIS domain-containing protein [Pelolinea sp.]